MPLSCDLFRKSNRSPLRLQPLKCVHKTIFNQAAQLELSADLRLMEEGGGWKESYFVGCKYCGRLP